MEDHTKYTARHVDTDLCFWRRPYIDNCVQVDLAKGKPENNIKKMEVLAETHKVQVQDIRGQESSYTLDKNGFVYLSHEIPELDRVSDEEHVKDTIIRKTADLVRKITGATKTLTFVHRVRCLAEDGSLLASNRAPAHSVHSDFTTRGALHHLKTLVPDKQERERLLAGRVLIINVWRPLKTIQRDPLTVCDWSSVNIRDEGIASRLTLPNGWNELGRYAFSPSQRWYYLSGQQPHEPLIFTQFDSFKVDEGGVTVPHSAFVDPEYSDSAARESLEIKMFAFV
ncbi:hypothetical protein PEX1_009620 [Penicillium expansum]|uniref:Methyltransferase n=1 Tax=Penicillium expansum TaxID=27334 RepID=A0A0A2KHU3_PENEN|nr:hypothetical protein PEX2_039920 [Penicillium expansum]KGO38761.1 hypothetical protein PEXP_110390 [Penicillium expansum]KGO54288.1 hypothetical protein PEX2_039920 [Penicillium expansum]KGO66476.1 hypothetical protein PEX1_009620 [Penicillium expansum]